MGKPERNFLRLVQLPAYLVISLWIIHILKLSLGLNLGSFGLLARDSSGFIGIFTAPFIHGSFQHLMSNSVPLFVMTLIIMFFYKRIAYQSILLIYILTGIAVWAFARPNVIHIGASGVVYGLVSFVFWTGIFRRNLKSIMLALVITILYSGYFFGILPNQPGISWESHLFGGLVGIIVAYWMRDLREEDEEPQDPWQNEKGKDEYFLPRDTFEETLLERAARRRSEQHQGQWTQDDSSPNSQHSQT